MGHGCHDCGCPNGCECYPVKEKIVIKEPSKGLTTMTKVCESWFGHPTNLELTSKEEPSCCGGGDFYGHESFCDYGHLAYELARARKDEAIELALLCAQDIVDGWPTLTFRTIGSMTKKVDTLKQALDAVKK